jgi:hypothetical protein
MFKMTLLLLAILAVSLMGCRSSRSELAVQAAVDPLHPDTARVIAEYRMTVVR